MDRVIPGYRTVIAAASLIAGPALMSIGDLLHPAESWDPAAQVTIIVEAGPRWYLAHLLLFVGWLLVIPGLLALSQLTEERKPVAGYVARLLMVASVGGLSAVFVFELLLGRFVATSTDVAAGVALLETSQSAHVGLAILPALLAFFVGTAFFVAPLASAGSPYRWPALLFALGALLILAEISLAQVLLSQIGNVIIFVASTAFARILLRDRGPASD